MSEPTAPFCYPKADDRLYHWELGCSAVPEDLATNPDWVVTEEEPEDRDACPECRAK